MKRIEKQDKDKELQDKEFENQIYQIKGMDVFLNLSLTQISKKLKVSNNTAAVTRKLTKRFLKNSNFRSVRRNSRGTIQESIPLDNINFETIIRENFEESSLYSRFNQGFYFLVFEQLTSNKKSLILKYAFLWEPNKILIKNKVYPFWIKVKNITKKGIRIQRIKRGTKYINKNNLPKSTDNPILHVRPKAKNALDTSPLPNGENITKQAYWINNSYIKKLINNFEQNIMSKSNIPYNNFNKRNTNQKKIISERMDCSTDYKGRLESHTILKVIYNEEDYLKVRDTYKSNKKINDIIVNDYEIKYGYYINKRFNSITEAIKYDVLSLDYLDSNDYEYKDYNVFNDLLLKLRKNLQLIEIEKDRFITEKGLKKGGIDDKEIFNYIEEVIDFTKKQRAYFNLSVLYSNDIGCQMFDLGFKDIFYEEILKHSGKFNYQTYKGNIMFTINKVESSVFTDLVMKYILDSQELYRHEIGEILENKFKIKNLNNTDILNFYNSNQGIYYCPHMDMFFENEDRYLEIILRRKR